MLTVRLRSLPDPYAKHLIQALIDHFFLDVEDRVRAVLQPKNTPRSSLSSSSSSPSASANPTNGSTPSSFYTIANANGENGKSRGNAPERLVTRQMKILKEQWAGLGLSMDYALVKGDAEMAGAVWRNFLGARGARGIVYPSSSLNSPSSSSPSSTSPSTTSPASTSTQYFRRSVNLSSSTPLPTSPTELEAEERKDDGSGVHDYAPSEAGKYVKYPELMVDVVRYVRREVKRLEGVRDEDVLGVWEIGRQGEGWEALRFGRIRE
ncbi:hypothetical protein K474DRAFT_1666625 [Panus rudis PR-1116 ss-1]|nr:hypothetical protein K474DRAFT_1666625 [Panus rudis PR-1116 ss-1]